MSCGNTANPPRSLEQWVAWFSRELGPPALDDDGMSAYLHHFADLGILQQSAENQWQISGIDWNASPDQIREDIRMRLETLSRTESGPAICYFLGQKPDLTACFQKTGKAGEARRVHPDTAEHVHLPERASDLSNLQIVKKVGRQLRPFLELEKSVLSFLEGPHTSKEDARRIYNFILSRAQEKAEPKKWEQLSRKRHK